MQVSAVTDVSWESVPEGGGSNGEGKTLVMVMLSNILRFYTDFNIVLGGFWP